MKVIDTAAELIDALGGPTKVASALGVQMPAVSAWKRHGISPSFRSHVLLLAHKNGIRANAACDLPEWIKIDDAEAAKASTVVVFKNAA